MGSIAGLTSCARKKRTSLSSSGNGLQGQATQGHEHPHKEDDGEGEGQMHRHEELDDVQNQRGRQPIEGEAVELIEPVLTTANAMRKRGSQFPD